MLRAAARTSYLIVSMSSGGFEAKSWRLMTSGDFEEERVRIAETGVERSVTPRLESVR